MCKTQSERKANELASNGKSLMEKRIAKGFKLSEVAGFAGISKDAYMDMESGKASVPSSVQETLDRLFRVDERVETVEVVKEIPAEPLVSMWAIDTVLAHITDIDIDENAQRALFRNLIDARTSMLESELFG